MSQPEPSADARYKFIVSSADEAVTVLRERLGENAKVISVRQVEGAGLARFLRAPKLEVIARVENPSAASVAGEVAIEEPMNDIASAPLEPIEEPVVDAANNSRAVEEKLGQILNRAGFNEVMKSRIRSAGSWERLVRMPLGSALTEVAVLLRSDYMRNPRNPLEGSAAFIGTPGSGKTTALCKRLVTDVFIRNRRARVLKLDLDRPNPSDALSVFCDAIGVPLVRDSAEETGKEGEGTLYVDLPGISTNSESDIEEVSNALEPHDVSARILVVNAAYDSSLIKSAYNMGSKLDATHVVFTHVDELLHWGKLWEFVIGQHLQPLFLSAGQNLAGDLSEQVFDSIMDRTFPALGARPAKTEAVT